MTQEEKQLLLKDLCTRLPYGVKCKLWSYDNESSAATVTIKMSVLDAFIYNNTLTVKPYLRPLSSMTEDERVKLSKLTNDKFKFYLYTHAPEIICYEKYNYFDGLDILDWLNEHHFDYRGLIKKGLALEAKEGMYEIK